MNVGVLETSRCQTAGRCEMNAEDWPLCFPKQDWQEVLPLADAVKFFAGDLVEHYRREWDSQTPRAPFPGLLPGGREWYLRRETGLRAFACYAARLRLKHFSKDGLITVAGYCEARLQEVMSGWGWQATFSAPPRWQKFIVWRGKTAPGFAEKLAVWKSRSNNPRKHLARYSPDPRIELYALFYDRAAPVPLEFCSENCSALFVSKATQCDDWPGKRTDSSRETVRHWRGKLGLKPSGPVVAKLPHHRTAKSLFLQYQATGVVIDHAAAKIIGLPFDFSSYHAVKNLP